MSSRLVQHRRKILIIALIVLGVGLRTYHYLRNPSVWHDEAAVLVNVLPLGFAELLGPLKHAEAAPPLFLWLERATSLVLGDSTMSLRLPPFLAGVLALILVAWTSRREFGPAVAACATLLVAVSDRLLWHACEAKPYSFDVLAAAFLLALYSATRSWPTPRRILAFLPFMPVIIWVSYPGCFLCGGVLLALAPATWRERRLESLAAFAALALAVIGSFALLYFGPAKAQRCAAMDSCWTGQFPPWDRPWSVPVWTVASIFDAFRYCFMPCGYLLTLFCFIGAIRLWRSKQSDFVILALSPLVLNLAAAYLHGYPFGGARVVVHGAPAIAILSGVGVITCLSVPPKRRLAWTAVTAVVVLAPFSLTIYRLAVPWFRADCAAAAEFVLMRRSGDEPVYANHWEFEYYCRGIGEKFRYLPPRISVADSAAWVIVASVDSADRLKLVNALRQDGRVVETREFVGATVLRLASSRTVAAQRPEGSTCEFADALRRAIKAATYPALNPASMFTTTTLAEHALSIVRSGATPWNAAP